MMALLLGLITAGQIRTQTSSYLDAPRPNGRYAHCAVMYKNHMVVYGGRGYIGTKSSLETFRSFAQLDLVPHRTTKRVV